MITKLLRGKPILVTLLLAIMFSLLLQTIYALYAPLENQWNTIKPDQMASIDYKHYPYAETFNQHLRQLQQTYPHLMQVDEIGTTHQGRQVLACTVSNLSNGGPDHKPALLIIGQQHAFEAITSQIAVYNIEYLLKNYGEDPMVTALLDTRTLYVVPQANPDGNDFFLEQYVGHRGNARTFDLDGDGEQSEDRMSIGFNHYSKELFVFRPGVMLSTGGKPFASAPVNQLGDRQLLLRKDLGWVDHRNRSVMPIEPDGDPLVGVDLNRNWDTPAWKSGDLVRPQDAGWDRNLYGGATPFSEPETQALKRFVENHPNIIMATDLHSSGMLSMFPFSDSEKDQGLFSMLGTKLSQLLSTDEIDCQHFLYEQRLAMAVDWLYEAGIVSSTLEIFGVPNRGVRYHEGTFSRRIWPTNVYVRYFSPGWYLNPPPSEVQEVVKHKNLGLLYLLAVMPQVGVSEMGQEDGQLVLEIRNTGGIGVTTHLLLSQNGKTIAQETVENLTATHLLKVSSGQPNVPMSLQITTEALTANSHPAQGQRTTLSFVPRTDGTYELVSGSLLQETAVSEHFSGWSAPLDIWSTPRYRLGTWPKQ